MHFHMETSVTKAERVGGKINLTLSDGTSLEVDYLLCAAGVAPGRNSPRRAFLGRPRLDSRRPPHED